MEAKRLLLIVEDDAAFARTLNRSFERRGYTVLRSASVEEVVALLRTHTPDYAVVDLKLAGGVSGLACVQMLHAHDPDMLIVVLTGYASIATAVEAIKLGACHYLAKPSNTDDIEAAFGRAEGGKDVGSRNGPPRSRRSNGNAFTRPLRTPASTSPRRPGGWGCIDVRWRESSGSSASSNTPHRGLAVTFPPIRAPPGQQSPPLCRTRLLANAARLHKKHHEGSS
jgi:two-component system response regulator RegA